MSRYRRLIEIAILLICTFGILVAIHYRKPRPVTWDLPTSNVQIPVVTLSQYPLYPTGCESVTAVMALHHAGSTITIDEFIDEHLSCSSRFYQKDGMLFGPYPFQVFVGDPRSEQSYGCMAPVIEKAIRSCLTQNQQVLNVSGTDLDQLCQLYIDAGVPVIVWATMDMKNAAVGNSWFLEDGRFFVWTAGEHCLLLVGYDEMHYYFNDPRHGKTVAYAKTTTERAFAALGKQALVIQ